MLSLLYHASAEIELFCFYYIGARESILTRCSAFPSFIHAEPLH